MKLPANWKTTVSGIGGVLMAFITWLSTVSYDQGPIGMIIPKLIPIEYKGYVTWTAAFASLILLAWNAIRQKDKDVVGGTVQQTTTGKVAEEGTQTLVDQTVLATIKSGEPVTPEQREAVRHAI